MPKQRDFEPYFSSSVGLKQANAETNMPPGSLIDVLNMNLDGIGGKSPRGGYTEYFHLTNGLGGSRVHETVKNLIQFKPTTGGTNQTLAFAKDTIYLKNPSGMDTSVLVSGLTSGVRWSFVQYNDFIHGVNNNDHSILYDGSNVVTISLTGVSANLSLLAVNGGSLVVGKTYEYVATRYDATRARESAPYNLGLSAPSLTISSPNQTIRVSNPPAAIAGEGMTHWRLYRRATGETKFTRTAEIAIANATYDDTGDATGTIELEVDTGEIDKGFTAHPQSPLVAEAFDRVFMVVGSKLIYSQAGGRSFAWPTGNFLPIGTGDGSPIIGLHRHGESLIIHKRNSWWRLSGDPATTVPTRLSKVGTQDVLCSASDDNVILRLTNIGLYLSSPTQFDVNDLREQYIGRDVITEESLIDWSGTANVNVFSYNGRNSRHIYVAIPDSSNLTTKFLVYQTLFNEWVKYEVGTDIYSFGYYESNGQTLTMIGDGYGMVWTWNSGLSDGVSLDSSLLNGTVVSATNNTLTDTSVVDDSGTATSGTTTKLNDTTKAWTVNEWVGAQVYKTGGTGSGEYGTVLSNTATQLTITGTWTAPDATTTYVIGGWPVNGMIGVLVRTGTGTGGSQARRIQSNTPTTITLTASWTTNPDSTTTYTIGAIRVFAKEFWDSNQDPHLWKRMRWVIPYVSQSVNSPITISFSRDFSSGYDTSQQQDIGGQDSHSDWGSFQWGVGKWGGKTTTPRRIRLHGKYRYYSISYGRESSGEPFTWNGHGAVFQILYDRNG